MDEPVNISLPPIAHPQLAALLRGKNNAIVAAWLSLARECMDSAKALPKLALQDSLPAFLDKLAETLATHDKRTTLLEAGEIGKTHGEERARQSSFDISEILQEYGILRVVIFRILEADNPLSQSARDIILATIDEGIRNAVQQFAEDRTKALEHSNRDLEQFAAVAAHDLKSPLATISGYLEMIAEDLQDTVAEEVLNEMKIVRRAGAQMAIMVDRLLEYSAVGKSHAAVTSVDTKVLVHQVLERLAFSREKASAQVEVGDLPVVQGDHALLSMLFQNLLSNALKFKSERPAKIIVRASEDPQDWIFSVADNGVGFDPKHADQIFSFSKQFHQSQKFQGFGIGLATAKKVVRLHDGEIWAESKLGDGATFYFSLPKEPRQNHRS